MPKQKLTHKFIQGLQPPKKPTAYYDSKESGLILRLSKTGSKTFAYRYRFYGRNRRFTIGQFPAISLSKARDRVQELKVQVNNGIDPQGEKQAKKSKPQPKTFDYLAEEFKKKHLPTLRDSTQSSYSNRIDTEMMPAFKGMYVKDISRGVIIELLEDIAIERNEPTHSNRVRAILSSMFTFGVQREIAEYNPVKSVPKLGKEQKRDRVLNEQEIKGLWQQLDSLQGSVSSALKILLLLGQRKSETCRMKWKDIDLDNQLWIIPAHQTKANRKHKIPLPPLAVEIIESLASDSDYVFESANNNGQPVVRLHNAFKRAAKQADISNIRIHDLRRTAATYMAESGTDRTILGKVLNHKGLSGDSQVTARYDRHGYVTEKQAALNRWASKLQQIIEGKEAKIHKIG